MSPSTQLEQYAKTYLEARERARSLVGPLSEAQFNWKPGTDRWSVGECVYHLNVISQAYLPVLQEAVASAERGVTGPFGYGWLSRKFISAVKPGSKPTRTTGAMKPPPAEASRSGLARAETLTAFEDLMLEFADVVRDSEGIDLAAVKVRSPFLWILRLPVGTFLEALGLHALRHLDQAMRVTQEVGFPASGEVTGRS